MGKAMEDLNIGEFLSGIFLGLVGLLFCLGSYTVGLGSLANPGGGFVPFLVGAILFLLSLIFLLQRVKNRPPVKKSAPFWPEKSSKIRVAYTLGAILVYVLIFEQVGFAVATFVLFFFLLKMIDPIKWQSAVLHSLMVTLVWFVLFQVILKAQLPEGWVSWWRISRWIF
jgi:putative tricarboxylic transport membrane protein